MCIGAIASIAGGLLGSEGAKDAAAAQSAAAAKDLAFQKETRDLIFDRLDPFYQPGITAQNALAYELGLGSKPMIGGTAPTIETFSTRANVKAGPEGIAFGDILADAATGGKRLNQWARNTPVNMFGQPTQRPWQGGNRNTTKFRVGDKVFDTMEDAQAYANANKTGATAYQGFQATPGYQFQFDQGTAAVNALAGARGGLNSGRTLQDLTTFGQGLANQEYGNYLARLSGMAQGGQAAAGAQANAATNAANGVSNALAAQGNAAAAGAVGRANAWTGAINNGLSMWQYQQGVNPGGWNIGKPGSLFGGNSWG